MGRNEIEKGRLYGAVDEFAYAMRQRLYAKADEGFTGWDDEEAAPTHRLREMLKLAYREDRWVDVANIAMMLWRREGRKAK